MQPTPDIGKIFFCFSAERQKTPAVRPFRPAKPVLSGVGVFLKALCAGLLFLPCKHDADGARAGVAADGGADVGLIALFKIAVFLQAGFYGVHAAGFRLAGRDEHQSVLDIVPSGQTVGDVLAHADGQAAAVFLDSVLHCSWHISRATLLF